MAVSVASMVAGVRVDSGLGSNQLYDDDAIADMLNDAYQELRDLFIARFAQWFQKKHRFSLSGGAGNNEYDLLTNVPDFQEAEWLNRSPDADQPETIVRLGSQAERNYVGGLPWALGGGRKYDVDGDNLIVYPPSRSNGNYELAYIPFGDVLALPRVIPWTEDDEYTSDLTFSLQAGAFTDADLGGTLTVAGVGVDGYDGEFTVSSIISPTEIAAPPACPGALVYPSTATFSLQQLGTRAFLPQQLTPWALYCKLHASITIRTARQQDTGDLEVKFRRQETRAVTMSKTRSLGSKQAPLTRRRRWGLGATWGG